MSLVLLLLLDIRNQIFSEYLHVKVFELFYGMGKFHKKCLCFAGDHARSPPWINDQVQLSFKKVTPVCVVKCMYITVLPFFRIFGDIRNFCSPWKSPHMVFQLHEKNPQIIFFS